MKRMAMKLWALAAAGFALAMLGTGVQPAGSDDPTRFEAVDVYVDSGVAPLAAYQLELLTVGTTEAKLVGVEGGERGAFEAAPYYDPRILHGAAGERVILLAYSLKPDAELPKGETRVARLHLQVPAKADLTYRCVLAVAGDSSANEIKAVGAARVTPLLNNAAPAAPAPR